MKMMNQQKQKDEEGNWVDKKAQVEKVEEGHEQNSSPKAVTTKKEERWASVVGEEKDLHI